MLKFLSAEDFLKSISVLSGGEQELICEYVRPDCDFGEFDVAYSYFAGSLIVRFYSDDAGYHFEAPIPLSDNADARAAYAEIGEYCKLQAIPEVVVGVPADEKELVLRGAKLYKDGIDDDGTLAIEILTECMVCEELPEFLFDDVYLGEFAESYAGKYEKLIKNVNLNRYFGYNITDDLPNGDGKDFINFVRDEFERGESMTFAATVLSDEGENVFVGEGALYGFNGRRAASVSFRVLPEYHRRGIGRKIFLALISIAEKVGLETLTASIMCENKASLALVKPFASSVCFKEDKVDFSFDVKNIVSGF